MNKRAQVGMIGFVFMLVVFNIVYFSFLAGFFQDWVAIKIAEGGYSATETFFLGSINLWIILGQLFGILIFFRYGAQ